MIVDVMFNTIAFCTVAIVVTADDTCMPKPDAARPLDVRDTIDPAVMGVAAINGMPRFCTVKQQKHRQHATPPTATQQS